MKNVELKYEDKYLIIKIDLEANFGASASGKTEIVATTAGNQPVGMADKKLFLGLNLYKKR